MTATANRLKTQHLRSEATARLTPTERRILDYVEEHNGMTCSKDELADLLGRNRKTIDRLVKNLRERGFLIVKTRWGKGGAQLANSYSLGRVRRQK